jgi:DMSO/TMAO reductase YedYZ molybdopterin-dependent catalytic subunit
MNKANLVAAFLLLLLSHAPAGPTRPVGTQAVSDVPQLRIGGEVSTPLALSAEDLKRLPRQNLRVLNPHTHNTEAYEGVAIHDLLHRAGVPEGENLRGVAMTSYVVAEGADGYRVVFSLAELDPGISDSEAIIADAMNGVPLDANHGPFQLVVPHDKRPACWVRMLKSLTVGQAGK